MAFLPKTGILLFIYSCAACAQEWPEKCDAMVNFLWPDTQVIINKDSSRMARIEPASIDKQKNLLPPTAFVYLLEGKNYIYTHSIKLPQNIMPSYSLLDDKGRLIVYGQRNTHWYEDDLYIFSEKGDLQHHIAGKDVLNDKELKKSILLNQQRGNCPISDPWICWGHEPEINEDGHIEILDTLDYWVEINTETGKIKRRKTNFHCKD